MIGNYADCKCKPDYYGNPYVACKPECVVDSDCPRYLDCVRNKCIDPCPGACGINAICDVLNHQAMCNCPTGYTGSPLARCHPAQEVISKCSEGISAMVSVGAFMNYFGLVKYWNVALERLLIWVL